MTPTLEDIQARCEAATEGPWNVGNGTKLEPETSIYCDDALGTRIADAHNSYTATSHEQEKRNATFIAHARTDIPALLSLIREKDQVIERLERAGERMTIDHGALEAELATLKAGQQARDVEIATFAYFHSTVRAGASSDKAYGQKIVAEYNATHS